MKKINLLAILSSFLIVACGGGDDGGGSPDPIQKPDAKLEPKATTLIFPENNTECNEGNILNDTESSVTFEWNASENTDSYQVNIVNLNTDIAQKANATTTNQTITLERGTPYEWFVVSEAGGTNKTATSAKWKFYNQGPGVENYAPFPAEVIDPKRGASLETTTNVILKWNGSDVDNDIASYEVLFGTEVEPTNSLGSTTDSSMQAPVVSNQVYYWRVVTKDSQGNTSKSETFEFKVL